MSKQIVEIVDGYVFHSTESAKQARKEVEGIRYIKKQLNMEQATAVLQVYNQILKENTFKTIVGYSYLRELQEYLYCNPEILNEDVRPLNVQTILAPKENAENISRDEKEKNKLITSRIINLILAILVIAMLLLMYFSQTPTIVNYENKIIDKYEKWENELSEREKKVEELEKELGIQP